MAWILRSVRREWDSVRRSPLIGFMNRYAYKNRARNSHFVILPGHS